MGEVTKRVNALRDAVLAAVALGEREDRGEPVERELAQAREEIARALEQIPDGEVRSWIRERIYGRLSKEAKAFADAVELPWAARRLFALEERGT